MNTRRNSRFMLPVCLLVLAVGAPSRGQAPDDGTAVVARVGGEEIIKAELVAKLNAFRSQAQVEGREDPAADPTFPSRILQAIIDQVLLSQYAREQGFEVTDAEIDVVQQQAEANLGGPEKLAEALVKSEDTLEAFRSRLSRDLYFDKVVAEEIMPTISISDGAKEEFHSNNAERFELPDLMTIRHLFKKFDPQGSAEDRAAIVEEVRGFEQQMQQGTSLADLAREHSDNRETAANGGMTQLDMRGDSVLLTKLREIPVGQPPSILESDNGVHLIEVISFQPRRLSTYEEAVPLIERILTNQAIKVEIGRRVDQARAKAKVETFI